MIGLKILMTGLVVFVALGLIKYVLDLDDGDDGIYIVLGLGIFLSFIAVVTGALIMIWSL